MSLEESCRVLLVHDGSDVVRLLGRSLARERAWCETVSETESTSALDRLASDDGCCCCIVSDEQLAETTGLEFLRSVRDRGHDVPFVLLTSDGSEAVASEALDAGAADCLQRGSTHEHVERLATAIEEAVSTHRERRRLREEFQFLDRVLGTLDDIVYVTDTDGTPVYWNDAANRVTGYDSAEARSLDVLDLFPEDEHERVERSIESTIRSGASTFEVDLLTKDGDRIPYEFNGTALWDAEGDVVGICGTGRDVAQRVRYEHTLRSLHDTTRTLLGAASPERVASLVTGATGDVLGNPLSTVFLLQDDTLVPAATSDELRRLVGRVPEYHVDEDVPVSRVFRTGTTELVDDLSRVDDDRTRSARGALFLPLGAHGVLALARRGREPVAESDRRLAEVLASNAGAALQRLDRELELERREWMLQTLHGTARELMWASDETAIARMLVDEASDILDFSASALFLWNDQLGVLELAAATDEFADAEDAVSTVTGPDHPVWEAFVAEESSLVSDGAADGPSGELVQTERGGATARGGRTQLLVPVDGYGVFVATSREADAFDDTDVEFAELLAASASTALERAERERSMREQDRRLQERNEQLQRVDRLNAIIRDINRALLQADSRADIQQVVCETLLDVPQYAFTWIGSEGVSGEVVRHASAGEGRSFVDTVLHDGETSVPERVLESGDPVVVQNVHRAEAFAPWREAALNRGFRSLACVPLTHGPHEYGFLEIYADQPGVFGDDEVEVLAELGAQIANAIDAVEHKAALLTGRATEIELELRDVDDPLFRLARRTGATLNVEGLAPHAADAWNVYTTLNGVETTTFVEAARASTVVSNVEVLRTQDGTALLGLTIAEFSVADTVSEAGATVREFRVDPRGGRLTLGVPAATSVRSVLDVCHEQFPEVEFLRRQSTTSAPSAAGLRYGIQELLTNKQLEALQTAYFKGYFEWPRAASGEEVAATLGVSAPTFQQHLRKALAHIFDDIFQGE